MPPEMGEEMTEHQSGQERGPAISSIAILHYSAPSRRGEKGPEPSRGTSTAATQTFMNLFWGL